MKQEELDALPDASPRFGVIEEVIDGKRIRRPVMEPFQPFDFHEEDDPIFVVDARGERWFLGKINGVLHKRRH